MLIKDESLSPSFSSATCPMCRSGFMRPLRRRWWQRLIGKRRRLRCSGCGANLKVGARRAG
ncbi:MAG: hypothetical protein ACLFSR_10690 [Halomonas sp.]